MRARHSLGTSISSLTRHDRRGSDFFAQAVFSLIVGGRVRAFLFSRALRTGRSQNVVDPKPDNRIIEKGLDFRKVR